MRSSPLLEPIPRLCPMPESWPKSSPGVSCGMAQPPFGSLTLSNPDWPGNRMGDGGVQFDCCRCSVPPSALVVFESGTVLLSVDPEVIGIDDWPSSFPT